MKTYSVFTRTWWREAQKGDGSWPNNLVPCAGERSYLRGASGLTEDEAREICQDWNAEHKPGRLSLKAEFDED